MSWRDYERKKLGEAEETLHLIANLPAPDGFAERLRGRLRETPAVPVRAGRVLSWPSAVWRGAAAAAIVCAAAGGAWGVYRQVAPVAAARNAAPQVRVRPEGGFANAGAMRTPDSVLKTEAPKLDAKKAGAHSMKKTPPAVKKAGADR